MQPLVTLTIDGQSVSVPPGTTVLQAARSIGIEIPTLCYHAKLSLLGACRMCLVEVERMKAPQTACTTMVRPEMVVRTNTPDILTARRGMLEFLLTNHPLDCPVCDAGGECELQDAVFAHGAGVSRYIEAKRHKEKALPLGPTVLMDEERCILCRRCVRFLEEWADDVKLGYFERGRLTYLGIFPEHQLIGKFMGNVIGLCPVGALTSRTFRFQARTWELKSAPSLCTLCGVGCNVEVGLKADTLRRVSPRENPAVNDQWLCDKGRFGHGFVHGADRVRTPLIRRPSGTGDSRSGELAPATWDEALQLVAARLGGIAGEHGPDSVAALGSGQASNEANYLLQRVLRGVIGTNNVDHVGRLPESALPLDTHRLAQADLVLLVGVDPTEEAPLVELRLRHEAVTRGLKFVHLGARRVHLAKRFGAWLPVRPGDDVAVLSGLARLLLQGDRAKKVPNVAELTEAVVAFNPQQVANWTGVPIAALTEAADKLAASRNPLILYGAAVAGSPAALQAVHNLALLLGAPAAALAPEANSRGALDMGVAPALLPGRQPVDDTRVRDRLAKSWRAKLSTKPGLDVAGMKAALASGALKALWVMRSDPAAELPGWKKALQSGVFLVVQDLFMTETAKLADVVLPSASNMEEDGAYTNLSGLVQRGRQCVPLQGEARADWQIWIALTRAMDEDLGYGGPDAVMREAARIAPLYEDAAWEQVGPGGKALRYPDAARKVARVDYVPAPAKEGYPLTLAVGRALFDGAPLLAQTPAFEAIVPQPYMEINPADATPAGIKDGFKVKVKSAVGTVGATAVVTEDVAPGCVFLPLRLRDALAVVLLEDAPVTRVTVVRG